MKSLQFKLLPLTEKSRSLRSIRSHVSVSSLAIHPPATDLLPEDVENISKISSSTHLPSEINDFLEGHKITSSVYGASFTRKGASYIFVKCPRMTPPSSPSSSPLLGSKRRSQSPQTQTSDRQYMLFSHTNGKWTLIHHKLDTDTEDQLKLAIPEVEIERVLPAPKESSDQLSKPATFTGNVPRIIVTAPQPKRAEGTKVSRIYKEEDFDHAHQEIKLYLERPKFFLIPTAQPNLMTLKTIEVPLVSCYCAGLAQNPELVQEKDLSLLLQLYKQLQSFIGDRRKAETTFISENHAVAVQLFSLTHTVLMDHHKKLDGQSRQIVEGIDATMPPRFKELQNDYRDKKSPLNWNITQRGLNLGVIYDLGYAREFYADRQGSLFTATKSEFKTFHSKKDQEKLKAAKQAYKHSQDHRDLRVPTHCGYSVGSDAVTRTRFSTSQLAY